MPSVKIHPIDEHDARQIIEAVTGERPDRVQVAAGPALLTCTFRVQSGTVRHRYLFKGDGSTDPQYWTAALQEICSQEGCTAPIDPDAPVVQDRDCRAPGRRVCSRHAT